MKTILYLLCACTLLLLCAPISSAQQSYSPAADEFETTTTHNDLPKRKKRSIFHRPEEDSPAKQLAFGEALEAKGRLGAARDEYNALVHHWHNAPEAPIAQFRIARIRFGQGKYSKAFKAFQYLIEYYAGHFKYNEVLDYQFRIANHVIGDRWGDIFFLPGFEAPERALPLLNQIIANAPNWEQVPHAYLTIGMIHEEIKDYEGAVAAYDSIAQFHRKSPEAEKAAFQRAACLCILSDKTPRDEKRCRTALSALATFLARHKESSQKADAETRLAALKLRLENMYYERALFYDTRSNKPEAALIAYRDFIKKFPMAENGDDVRERIETLELQVAED
ncbi:MAG: tetratricopeptide repeat protein [Verrucomicrobia bacterium]|nr:tetratricopeptide repeat protein [Verrucomicrobiota bacterium]